MINKERIEALQRIISESNNELRSVARECYLGKTSTSEESTSKTTALAKATTALTIGVVAEIAMMEMYPEDSEK